MPRYWVLAVVLAALCSCSPSTHREPGWNESQPGNQAWLASLPALPEDIARESAAATTSTVDGAAATGCCPLSYSDGTAKVLPAAPGGISWAYYVMPTNGFPALQIQATLQEASDQVYFGVANWELGRWDFSAPIVGTEFSKALTAPYVSGSGNAGIVVVAYDGVTARVESAALVLDQPGWQKVTITEEYAGYSAVVLFTKDEASAPCIAALRTTPNELAFYRSAVSRPDGPEDWTRVVADIGTTGAAIKRLAAAYIDDCPAMAYYVADETNQYQLHYCRGTKVDGSGEWVECDIGEPSYLGGIQLTLLEYSGKPHIAFDKSADDAIWIAIGNNATPASGEWAISKIRDDAYLPALAVVNNHLAVGFLNDTYKPCYARTTIVKPNGTGSWFAHVISASVMFGYGARTDLIVTSNIDMEPVPLFGILPKEIMKPEIYCADVSEPVIDDWDYSAIGDVRPKAFKFDLSIAYGAPAAAYFDDDTSQLGFANATTGVPRVNEDWQMQTIASGLSSCFFSLADVDHRPGIAYDDGSALYYVYYDE